MREVLSDKCTKKCICCKPATRQPLHMQ